MNCTRDYFSDGLDAAVKRMRGVTADDLRKALEHLDTVRDTKIGWKARLATGLLIPGGVTLTTFTLLWSLGLDPIAAARFSWVSVFCLLTPIWTISFIAVGINWWILFKFYALFEVAAARLEPQPEEAGDASVP